MEYLFIKTEIRVCGGTVPVGRRGDFDSIVSEQTGLGTGLKSLVDPEELFAND